jgi:hypothetical protein
MRAHFIVLGLNHVCAKVQYASPKELCAKSSHRARKQGTVDIYRRPQCLHAGSYYNDTNGAWHTNSSGFYSYNEVAHWEQDVTK